jgi:hypothetical protein
LQVHYVTLNFDYLFNLQVKQFTDKPPSYLIF